MSPSFARNTSSPFERNTVLTPLLREKPPARHHLSARLNTSRYYGTNNVFFDATSPVTNSALSDNGEENVTTESASVTLTSALSPGS